VFADRPALQAGLSRYFGPTRIEYPIGIQAKVTIDGNPDVFDPGQNFPD